MPQILKPAISDSWTTTDQERALSEGWGIFDNGCYVEIMRHDRHTGNEGRPAFKDDDEALNFVREKAGTDPIYTLALLNVENLNNGKAKENSPRSLGETKINGDGLSLPWKVTQLKSDSNFDGLPPFCLVDNEGGVLGYIKEGSIAQTIVEVVNIAADKDTISMSPKTYALIMGQIESLQIRLRKQTSNGTAGI